MHTAKVIGAGLLLLGVFLLAARFLGGGRSAATVTAAKVFIPVWFLIAVVNLWFGVARAGYSVRDEVPFLLVNFAVPAAVAALVWWRA